MTPGLTLALGASVPWVVAPIVATMRASRSTSLEDVPATPSASPALVSVIIPARNERRNIERCVRSVLATTYPAAEVVVVDDHSDDGTGDIARAIARSDVRLRVIDSPPLPDGWFGKQWACATGAQAAHGRLLCFTDADTTHAPDLLVRAVNALVERGADLLTVAGRQEMHGFWERVVQPFVFGVLLMRFGGTEIVSRTRRPVDAIANGQFMLFRRESYDALGGHASVRDVVAEDLAFAQHVIRGGYRLLLVRGERQLSTRMYVSRAELVRGWGKNIYAGGLHALPANRALRALFPAMLLFVPIASLLPPLALLLGLAGALPNAWLVWGAIATAASLVWWLALYHVKKQPLACALLYPLGAFVFGAIAMGAIARGRRVGWKGRQYVSH